MGKVVMPKNSASTAETQETIRIYYDANDWLENSDFISEYKKQIGIIGDDSDSSAYTKKSQIGAYYGFIEWQDINSKTSPRRITRRGRIFWEHIASNNKAGMHDDLMSSLEEVVFGRGNYACQTSDSDIEPPCLFLRATMDLSYLTNIEFAYLLYEMADKGQHYTDTLRTIREYREKDEVIELDHAAAKYSDVKPIIILERWGVLKSDNSKGFKRTFIDPDFLACNKSRLRALKIYNVDKTIPDNVAKIDEEENRISGGCNELYYGVPGSGKSYAIDEVIKGAKYERVVFHPDYSYSDFVGQIMPRLKREKDGEEEHDDKKLSYVFVPGPFTKAVKNAMDNPAEMFYLVIEEINRGNAPAIFGDVFQMLDRETDGSGKFNITNYEMGEILYGEGNEKLPISMPSNLTILATMNTSDQNVFTLDTAFQRRWNMKYVPNKVCDAIHATKYIDDREEITWSEFADFVNKSILDYSAGITSLEDKQLGAYFVREDELNRQQFAEKALKYLWDDVYKMDRGEFFNSNMKSIGDIIESYVKAEKAPLKRVMKADVYRRMMDITANTPAEAYDMSEVFDSRPLDEEEQ